MAEEIKEKKKSAQDIAIENSLNERLVHKTKKIINNLKFKIRDKKELSANLNQDDIVLDLGGHLGNFTIDIHDKVKEIIIYEPFHPNIEKLKENLINNNIQNSTLIETGVWEKDNGEATFHFKTEEKGETVSVFTNRNKKNTIRLQMQNMEEVLQQHPTANVIKMDIEGSEYGILKNCLPAIAKQINKIGIEFHCEVMSDKDTGLKRRTDMTKFYEIRALLEQYYPYIYLSKESIKKEYLGEDIEYFFNGTTFITCLKEKSILEKE